MEIRTSEASQVKVKNRLINRSRDTNSADTAAIPDFHFVNAEKRLEIHKGRPQR